MGYCKCFLGINIKHYGSACKNLHEARIIQQMDYWLGVLDTFFKRQILQVYTTRRQIGTAVCIQGCWRFACWMSIDIANLQISQELESSTDMV